MSENSSNDQQNSSENDDDFRLSAVLLRNDIKRRVHNGIEKRRKDKINYWIYKLAELLPFKEPKRESKTHLLENIYKYINELKDKNNGLMFGSVNAINSIHVEEIRRLTKRCKELEEINVSYYRLLEMAGISPNSWPQDIQFERPTKYSKKISEQQLSQFLEKSSDKKLDKLMANKRTIDSDDNSVGQSSKKSKSSKLRSKKRKDRERERDLKCSPPTPVLPKTSDQMSSNVNSVVTSNKSVSSGQSTTSGPIVLLNDQNLSTINTIDDSPRLIVNTSNNGFSGLNTIQFRPTVGPQQLQILSTTSTIDALNANSNLLSGQILFNLNPPAPPPQPQATAVLLPNGQILPIITQPQQQQQQSLILGPNQSFVLTTPTVNQTQQTTIINGQTANISSNIKTIDLTQNRSESQKPVVVNEKPKELTTTIETIVSQKYLNKKKFNKNIKKQLFLPKIKNTKKDKRKQEVIVQQKQQKSTNNEKTDEKIITKELIKSCKSSDNKATDKSMFSSKLKNKIKSRSSDKTDKTNENIVKNNIKNSKSKPVLTEKCETPDKKLKDTSNCDILAKATQSIFSPPPNTCPKQVAKNLNKKEVSISNIKTKDNNKSNKTQKEVTINDINKSCNKFIKTTELKSNRVKSESGIKCKQNEVINGFCANSCADSSVSVSNTTSANITNKANIELINDTNKNVNYIENRNTSEDNSKIEKTIASGNKAEINKKSVHNLNNSDVNNTSSGTASSGTTVRNISSVENKLLNASTPDRSTIQTTNCQSNARHHSFNEQNLSQNTSQTMSTNSSSDNNRLSFGFSSNQSTTDTTGADNQSIVNESEELPSILLSLNDANEVSAESVHSVSNSSLPAFLSLSPEHLNEYLPKDNITNTADTVNTNRVQIIASDVSAAQFRLNTNQTNIEQHSNVRPQETNNRLNLDKEQQNYNQYSKPNESSVAPTTHTESRSSYTSNFPTISSLITNDYSDFSLNSNKSMFTPNNSTNYFDSFTPNPLINSKMNSQNNNFLQFPLQNDSSIMPLYPMHSYHPIPNYLQNNTNTNNTNRDLNSNPNRNTFFSTNETHSSVVNNTAPKVSQNPNQSQTSQSRSQTTALASQQPKATPAPQQTTQNQSNAVMPMRSQRNSSTEQQLQPQQRQHSSHPSQRSQHTSPVTSNNNSTNKTNSNSTSVQYSANISFSNNYSAEALIRQNEPTVHQISNNEQNRYNTNTTGITGPLIAQQTHNSSNLSFNSERNTSRPPISYSAESLIQSNSMNNSNQISNKTTQRDVETESLNAVNSDNNNRISYYQHFNHNNTSNNISNSTNTSNNLSQRSDPNNSNNLFNFDHSLNSRIMSSNPITQNCGNSYPQITFNSHLPDIRTSTATTSSEPLFPITTNAPTVITNRSLTTNSGNSITNNTNNTNNSAINSNNSTNQSTHTIAGTQPQHSPVIYPPNSSQNANTQQNKRTTNNNGFNSGVNAFIHSNNSDNYSNNPNNSNMYSTSGSTITDPNVNTNANHYQRSPRSSDLRFGNCLQPTNQNTSNPSMTQHNNANNNCFFGNTATHANTTFFPTSSSTPFPPLLPTTPTTFDATASFSSSHRPPMFPNTFMTDFNSPFVNTGANTPLSSISGSNFNINPSVTNSSSNNTNKSRDTHQTNNTRGSSTVTRSPNQSKHSKISGNSNNTSNTKTNTKKQNNSKHNETSNTASRNSNDNYFSMNDLMSSTTPTNQNTGRYSNFAPNTQTHNQSRQPVPSPSVSSSHSTNSNNNNNKNVASSADTSSSYPLFRPQSQNVNNSSNASNVANFSVNSLHNANRSVPTTSTPSNFGSSSGGHHTSHTSHATNFHLMNIFPDINSNNESLAISPMKFAPPVTPVVPPPVVPTMDANPYPGHHNNQNLYPSHHSSARISAPHNTFNSLLSSGTPSAHHPNTNSFDPHITPNNRTATNQMPGIGANTTHPHSHHNYSNIVPSFNF